MSISEAHKMNCMDGLSYNRKFNLLVADPPYGIDGNSHRKNKSRGKLTMSKDYHTALWDQPKPDDEYFKLAFQSSINQIFGGGNYFEQLCSTHKTPRRHELNDWLSSHGTGWIVWDKCNGNTSYNDYELAWTSFPVPTKIFKFMWNGMMQGKSIIEGETMQGFKEKNEFRIHPTQKPVKLYKWLFLNYAAKGDTIVDTHLGSGSSRIAAAEMNFDFTGYEIDPVHFSDQQKRFNAFKSQLILNFNDI